MPRILPVLLGGDKELTLFTLSDTLPVWSADSVQALHEAGVSLRTDDAPLLRVEAAKLLYQVRQLMG